MAWTLVRQIKKCIVLQADQMFEHGDLVSTRVTAKVINVEEEIAEEYRYRGNSRVFLSSQEDNEQVRRVEDRIRYRHVLLGGDSEEQTSEDKQLSEEQQISSQLSDMELQISSQSELSDLSDMEISEEEVLSEEIHVEPMEISDEEPQAPAELITRIVHVPVRKDDFIILQVRLKRLYKRYDD